MLEFSGVVACLCEGAGEQAIMDLLWEHNLLIFNELLDDKIIRIRSAKNFEKEYLRKGFDEKLTIVRILDSRRENFELSKFYKDKISVVNVITAPEIEMLIIHNENKYSEFKKSRMKPYEFCKSVLQFKNVKSYDFVKSYFSDPKNLIEAIKKYKQKANMPKDEACLFDLIKEEQIENQKF